MKSLANRIGLAIFCLTLLSRAASAAQVSYYGADDPRGTLTNSSKARDDFQNSLSSFGVDTLENYKAFAADPSLTFAPLAITAKSDVSFVASSATFAVSGTKALLDQGPPALGGTPFDDSFTISQPVTAFGFFVANAGDAYANTISLILENTLLGPSATRTVNVTSVGPGTAQNNTFFFGVTDSIPFNKVSIHESEDYDGTLYDNITVGFVVPEPSTLALAGIGAFALIAAARRRIAR